MSVPMDASNRCNTISHTYLNISHCIKNLSPRTPPENSRHNFSCNKNCGHRILIGSEPEEPLIRPHLTMMVIVWESRESDQAFDFIIRLV